MRCETWREAISAVVDGEDPGLDLRLVDAHMARCADCRRHREELHVLRRSYAFAEADQMPDLAVRISRLDRIADRMSRWGAARVLLALVAMQIIVLSFPQLAVVDDPSPAHDARHLGAFTLAYGAGLLIVVWRPARARTVLPVAATLAAALTITAGVDIAQGRVPLTGELLHLPELISVVLVWSLTVPRRTRSGSSSHRSAGDLRAVLRDDRTRDESDTA